MTSLENSSAAVPFAVTTLPLKLPGFFPDSLE
jgi:hypothetical protein